MGIKGLWKEVQPTARAAHISQFRGQRVGIDSYCWLHRAVLASTMALATSKPCDRFISYFMARIDLLLRFGVTPVVIFDGAPMPMKAQTDADRHQRRQEALADGLRLLNQGHTETASRILERSIDVSTEIAKAVISAVKDRGIEVIVSPYEADAQLAYLCREGFIQAVISEDSDLLAYGCSVLLAKMDAQGNCDAVHINDVYSAPAFSKVASPDAFLTVCILSGCDYLPSLPSIGFKTAMKLVGSSQSIPQLMTMLALHGCSTREVSVYEENFHKTLYCFSHHLVFDPTTRKIVPFRPLPQSVLPEEPLVGKLWTDQQAVAVCADHTHDPCTLQPYEGTHTDSYNLYQKLSRRGQKNLTEFVGFEKQKSNRILQSTAKTSAFIGGDCCGDHDVKRSVVIIHSKYFPLPRDTGLEGSSSESFSPKSDRGSPTANQQPSSSMSSSQDNAHVPKPTPCPFGNSACSTPHSSFHKCPGTFTAPALSPVTPHAPAHPLYRDFPEDTPSLVCTGNKRQRDTEVTDVNNNRVDEDATCDILSSSTQQAIRLIGSLAKEYCPNKNKETVCRTTTSIAHSISALAKQVREKENTTAAFSTKVRDGPDVFSSLAFRR